MRLGAARPEDGAMIAVIFEVIPGALQRESYIELAAELLPDLEKLDGFISIERFESLTMPGKILSLSFWRDEAAVSEWRNTDMHRQAQQAGRTGIFADYRLRIAAVVRDYGMTERDEAPMDSLAFHQVISGR